MTVIFAGALMVILGVLYMAYEAISGGRLSGASQRESIVKSTTLEPKSRSVAFDPRANWPGLALVAVGAVFLLAGTAFL